jgi:hypothetical protein
MLLGRTMKLSIRKLWIQEVTMIKTVILAFPSASITRPLTTPVKL